MSISLKPHNIETYQKVKEKLEKSNKVAVIHPTGTGKMFVALKLLEENKEKKAIYLAPSNPILHDVKKNIFAEGMTMEDFPNIKRMTYQKLERLSDEEMQKLDSDIIILDEFHHCGAPEWGKGVERLIERNENASILGLSATPLRYFDGLRDMADELFENNVASEMTLEEAIESGILPESSYVSTLFGYDRELEDMQANIDRIKDKDKKVEAQDLLNNLREKLDENTQNLPELFSEHMKNKDGKYIIFCRNIEDMNEKIEQAQKMFGEVNPNITVRAVSSKVKESDKILTEFEQDTDEGTLKLLYAVDMLNEGYHISDLDGVVMMRPTFSPTIYTQQLGRALTVGGNKKPVVLDLVNNFDTCKIIEDFAEKMREYKGREVTSKTEKGKSSRLSIFDKTKEFREIAEKITKLSKRTRVTLEEKIKIFEKFAQTGEELVGNTIFEDYPIGQWAIQIRNSINGINNDKENRKKLNLTEEQLEKLENLGILERQIATIDEKIDSLVNWREKYPKAKIIPIASEEILKEYVKTDEEYKNLKEEYDKIQRYYEYVRARKSQGKLNQEQILKCKEGYVGGVFGHSTKVEELAKKYNAYEKDIDYILTEYGSMDNFCQMYNEGKMAVIEDMEFASVILRNVVDIEGKSSRVYDKLYRQIVNVSKKDKTGLHFYSLQELKNKINKLNEQEKNVLELRFGLIEGTKCRMLEDVGKIMEVTRERVRQIENKALRRLGKGKCSYDISIDMNAYSEEEREKITEEIERIKRDIQLQNGDLLKNINKIKSIQEENKIISVEKLKQRIIEGEEPIEKLLRFSYDDLIEMGLEQELVNKISLEIKEYKESMVLNLEELNFSIRTYNCLKRAGVTSTKDLTNMTKEQLMQVRNLLEKNIDEVVAKMQEYGISFKESDEQEQTKEEKEDIIEEIEHISEEDNKKIEEIQDITDRNEEKTQEEEKLQDMTPEQLQEIVSKNQKTIESNEETLKQELLQRILEQQRIIEEQQKEISRLNSQKKEL